MPHGQDPLPHMLEVFECVKNAQGAVITELQKGLPSKKITGAEADRLHTPRSYIAQKGYGEFFRHRTGHNVGADCHGLGVNLDSIEFPDPRFLLTEAIFTVLNGDLSSWEVWHTPENPSLYRSRLQGRSNRWTSRKAPDHPSRVARASIIIIVILRAHVVLGAKLRGRFDYLFFFRDFVVSYITSEARHLSGGLFMGWLFYM